MIKWAFVGMLVLLGLLDTMLVIACGELEKRNGHKDLDDKAQEEWLKSRK